MLDYKIEDLISKENIRQQTGLELIASENYVSKEVLKVVGSILTNKYAEGYPEHRYYGGCQYIDKVEQLAIDRVCKLFGCEYANVQPHSGSQANRAVIEAVCEPGDTILSLDLNHGGHLTHGSPVSFSGKYYNIVSYHTGEDGLIDYKEIKTLAYQHKPKLIIAGASAYSREWDYKQLQIAKIVSFNTQAISEDKCDWDNASCVLMFDMAHTAGLIAAGLLENPCNYADIVTSTTHKTLRGPRGGIILMKKDFTYKDKLMSKRIDSSVFPGNQGGPLEHIIAGKAVCFLEALQPDFVEYQKNVIQNSKDLAEAFVKRGYKIVSGGTDNHCFLIDLRTKFPEMTGKEAEIALQSVDITVNKNMVPFDDRSPFKTSGLRIGTPAITTRGIIGKESMETIAELCDKALENINDEYTLSEIKEKVYKFVEPYQNF